MSDDFSLSDDIYFIISGVCKQLCESDPQRFRIAKNEENDSEAICTEADEFLKVDGVRVGRDFRLYGLMAAVSSLGNALSDFALVLLQIKSQYPDSFEIIRSTVEDWKRHFPQLESQWIDLWNGGAP